MEIFGYMLDIDSIELFYTENGIENPYGIGELAGHAEPSYNLETQTLIVLLQFHDNGTPFYYEYAIVKDGEKYTYREIESQREGDEGSKGTLELIDKEDQIELRDEGNESYSNSFYIAKLDS